MHEILNNRFILSINGSDTVKFLQNLTTNDIINNDYCYTYMLNNQGRYLFDFFIFKISSDEIIIDISSSLLNSFMTKLNMYKLRANVNFIHNNNYKVIYYKSDKDDLNVKDILDKNHLCKFYDPRFKMLGMRYVVNHNIASDLEETSTKDLYLKDKYEYVIPDGDIDLIKERSIPLEYGAEILNAISYTKGCYIGQELISRTKYQGVIRKQLYQVSINNSSFDKLFYDNDLVINDQKIGTICSYYQNIGIALINTEKYNNYENLRSSNILIKKPAWLL